MWLNTAKDMAVASKRSRPVSCKFLATEISTVVYRVMRSLKVIYSLKSRLVTKDAHLGSYMASESNVNGYRTRPRLRPFPHEERPEDTFEELLRFFGS